MATITTRSGKGSALTHQEVDANFTGLNTELGQKELASNKGVANGYASLDAAGKVPSAQLPSYVDDVVEAANLASLPGTGETGKIYVTLDTNKTYRWSGSAYVEISPSPGSTDSLAEGSTNLYFTQARARASVSASGSLSYNSSTGVFSFSDAVTSVAGRTGAVTLTSSDVGLGNVENKSSATIRGELTSGNVTTALGFTPYNATNPSGYITSSGSITGDSGSLGGFGRDRFVYGDANNYGSVNVYTLDSGIGANAIRRSMFFRSNGEQYGVLGIHVHHANNPDYGLQLASSAYEGGAELSFRTLSAGSWNAAKTLLSSSNYSAYSLPLSGGLISGNLGVTGTINGVINTTAPGGSVLIKHSVSETDAWIFQENAANWGLYWKNSPSGNHTFGGYTSVGAELVGMSAANASGNGVTTSNFVGATSAIAQWMISNYTGYIWSASTVYAAGSMVVGGNTVLHAANYSSYALPLSGGTVTGVLTATGGSKITVQNATDGGSSRGIMLWQDSDTNWGIYMAQSGSGRSLSGNTAPASIDGRAAHAVRFRAYGSDATRAFIWENDLNQCVASLTPDTGNFYTRGQMYAGNSTTNLVLHTGNYSSYALPASGGTMTGGLNVGSAIGSRGTAISVSGSSNSSAIALKSSDYATVFSILPHSTSWTYLGTGVYYQNGSWVHASADSNNALLGLNGSAGASWYASNNSTASWNVATNAPLWNSAGTWVGALNAAAGAQVNSSVILTATNYSSYALPLSGGTMTGNLSVNGSVKVGNHGGSNAYDSGSGASLYFGGDTAGAYRIWTSFENFGGNYTKLNIDWHTGIRIGAYWGYGGIRFYNDSLGYGGANGYGNKVFSVAEGDSHVRVYNNLYVGGNLGLHAGNYSSYALPLSGGTLTNNLKIQPVSEGWAEGLSFLMPTAGTWGGIRWQRQRGNYDGNWAIGYTALDSSDDLVFIANNGGSQINNILRLTKAGVVTNNGHQILNASNYTSYAPSYSSGGTFTNQWYFNSSRDTTSNSPPLQAFSSGGSGAIMSFHRGGVYAINMGLDSDNVFRIGGWSAANNRLQMDMSGNLTMAGNVTAYSDERLKKDWSLIESGFVDRLAVLRCGTYTRIDSGQRQAGVSAQNMREILPEVVSEDNDGTLALAYGNAALVSAVELAKELVALKHKVAELEARVH